MHLHLISESPSLDPMPSLKDGLYVTPGAGGAQRATIARNGRVLAELVYDPRDVSNADLVAIYHFVAARCHGR